MLTTRNARRPKILLRIPALFHSCRDVTTLTFPGYRWARNATTISGYPGIWSPSSRHVWLDPSSRVWSIIQPPTASRRFGHVRGRSGDRLCLFRRLGTWLARLLLPMKRKRGPTADKVRLLASRFEIKHGASWSSDSRLESFFTHAPPAVSDRVVHSSSSSSSTFYSRLSIHLRLVCAQTSTGRRPDRVKSVTRGFTRATLTITPSPLTRVTSELKALVKWGKRCFTSCMNERRAVIPFFFRFSHVSHDRYEHAQ